jgi:hypothetical protein
MELTRKEFLDLAARGVVGAAAAYSTFDFLGRAEARDVADVLQSPEVRKVRDHIAAHKEEHIALVQRDLRQPSISSWNRGVKEMAYAHWPETRRTDV